jgi:hypothetical protein
MSGLNLELFYKAFELNGRGAITPPLRAPPIGYLLDVHVIQDDVDMWL